MRNGYIKVTEDDEITVVETGEELDNRDLWDQIGGYYEVVAPALLSSPNIWQDVRILCDDEGLYKDLRPNKLASGLYAGPSAIVGTCLFVRQGWTDDGEADIFPFYGDDLDRLEKFLRKLLETLKTAKF